MKSAMWNLRLVMLMFLVGLLTSLSSAQAAEPVQILSSTGYLDSSGYYQIVGEVQNIGDQAVNFVQVTATYYDSHGFAIDSRFDLTILYTILPRRKTPFEISLLDTTESSAVNHYTLSATYMETNATPMRLEILNNVSYTDTKGNLHIIGDLKNLGNETLINAKIVATYYGASSSVVAAALIGFDPDITGDFNPGQTMQFEIVLDQSRAQYVQTHILAAESNQYAMIPEFPHNMLMSLLMLLLVSTVFIAKKRPKTRRA
jgi:hypothetical protein